jgi:peptide/nickel transport system substrate-binding protein
VTRHIIWQALLALVGIALVFVVLFQLASTPETMVAEVEPPLIPVQGGTYIEGIVGYVERINPILSPRMVETNPFEQTLGSLVFDGLTTLDETGQITHSLALDWEVSEDGTVYEFRLRPDVTWHDGAPFTADDVAFTVQALQDPDYQGPPALQALWQTVVAEKLDSFSIRLTLEEPFPSFLYYTSIGILPAHLLSDVPAADLPTDEFSTVTPVGTGRFKVTELSSEQVTLVPNDTYWGGECYLAQLEFWLYASESDLLSAFRAGDIQGFHLEGVNDLASLGDLPNLQFYSAPTAGYGLALLNLNRETLPFFQVQEVRQALLLGLDRQALIDKALNGQGLVAHSPIVSFLWAYDPTVRQYIYDPERAVGLLDAAGWMDTNGNLVRDKEGTELAFSLLVSDDDPVMKAMAEEMVAQWSALGIQATVRPASSGSVSTFVRSRNFDVVLVNIAQTADPDPYPLWHSTQATGAGQNFSGFNDRDADVLMEEARRTTDPERLAALYSSFQQIFAEQVPSLLIYHPIYTYATDASVHDVQIPPILLPGDRFRNVAQWYVETESPEITDQGEFDKSTD